MNQRRETKSGNPCALLWDESFLWGIMARSALVAGGLPFEMIRAQDVQAGALSRFGMLYVPGGWAAQKIAALGQKGSAQIRSFVERGGSYFGICGGAGMALAGGLGLLGIKRKPPRERVASFSGRIRVLPAPHRIWEGIAEPVFTAAWPSQFEADSIQAGVLCVYDEALPDALSADIRVEEGRRTGWRGLEKRYGIRLDPERLRGGPAVVEGQYGQGRVILSLLHFDYPGDANGARALRNVFEYLTGGSKPLPYEPSLPVGAALKAALRSEPEPAGGPAEMAPNHIPTFFAGGQGRFNSSEIPLNTPLGKGETIFSEIQSAIGAIIETGERNALWRRRNRFLLQWRRGVRGLEYSTLGVLAEEIGALLGSRGAGLADLPGLQGRLSEVRDRIKPFAGKAIDLLGREKDYLGSRPLSPLHCDDAGISALRRELFGTQMSHGGEFKGIIDAMDGVLYGLYKSSSLSLSK